MTDPNAKDAQTIGAIIVASKKIDVSRRVYSLVERLALAGVLGLLVAALLAWYLSRRIVRPILQLSDAADAVASGDYAIDVPANAPGELGHQERDAPAQGRDQPDQLGRGFGDVAADVCRGVTVGERAESELGRAVPVDEAPPRRLQGICRRNRAMREHDAHPLTARRPGEVVQQAQAAVVGVVYVVDGEQQALTRRCQPD